MNWKQHLPFEDYILITKLSGEEVYNRLSDNIEPKNTFQISSLNRNSTKPYEGILSGTSFSISRIINYRNSFLPTINGHISTFPGKTQIDIKMRPATFVLVFMSVWLGVVGLVSIVILFVGLFQIRQILQSGFSPMLLIPFAMFIFGCLLTSFGFKAESKKSKEFLATLLNGQETS
jgi:hypothetical protein